ncbi:probable pre-mRNA-splicing factor ATP-dependent RNA helicase DEAH5 [Tanacetum coccineum]
MENQELKGSWGRGKGNPAEEYGKKAFITNSSHEISIATYGAADMLIILKYVYYLRAYLLDLMSWSCKDGVSRKTDELELCPVYSGRVTRRMHDTCFVDILDVKGKAGSVHVSRIVTRRVASAKDMVKRDQEVFVKVILVSNSKFSLSIRDVDQNTGKDLLSLKKSGEDGDGGHVNVGSDTFEEAEFAGEMGRESVYCFGCLECEKEENKIYESINISLPVLNFFLESKIEDGEGVRKGNPTGVFSLMEDNIDNDGQKRGKREDPPPNLIATDGDRFCKKRKQAVNWEFEGVNGIQFSHRVKIHPHPNKKICRRKLFTAGFLGSSPGLFLSTLPTRSAPTSTAFIYIPPPTLPKRVIEEPPTRRNPITTPERNATINAFLTRFLASRVVLAFAYVAIFIPRKPDITKVMAPRINDMVLKTYVNRAGLHCLVVSKEVAPEIVQKMGKHHIQDRTINILPNSEKVTAKKINRNNPEEICAQYKTLREANRSEEMSADWKERAERTSVAGRDVEREEEERRWVA